jgi:hypothetical protein
MSADRVSARTLLDRNSPESKRINDVAAFLDGAVGPLVKHRTYPKNAPALPLPAPWPEIDAD